MVKKEKFVYANSQNEAKAEFRARYKGLVPTRAVYAGTKHGVGVYQVVYRKRRKKK